MISTPTYWLWGFVVMDEKGLFMGPGGRSGIGAERGLACRGCGMVLMI